MTKLSSFMVIIALLCFFHGCGKNDENPDTQSPSVSLIAPVNGDFVSDSLMLTATASDDEGVSRVDFYVDDSLVATISDTPYSAKIGLTVWSDLSSLPVYALAYDYSDNTGYSDTVFVTIDRYSDGFRLAFSDISSNSVRLIFNRFNGPFSYYEVKQSRTSGITDSSQTVATIHGLNDTTITITGLSHSSDYFFRVFAVKPTGMITSTNEIRIVTDEEVPVEDTLMIFIPGTTYTRGDVWGLGDFNELPASRITLSAFYIDKYEVTYRQYELFVLDNGYTRRELWSDDGWSFVQDMISTRPFLWESDIYHRPDYPVVGVSYYEAEAFAKWSGKRLPTEAEWEMAARGTAGQDHNSDGFTDGFRFPWGNEFNQGGLIRANYLSTSGSSGDGYEFTSPVGFFNTGNSPFDVSDMCGNVAEWCSDWYDNSYYAVSESVNPIGPETGTERIIRGGSFINELQTSLTVTSRDRRRPDDQKRHIGFRCAKDAD